MSDLRAELESLRAQSRALDGEQGRHVGRDSNFEHQKRMREVQSQIFARELQVRADNQRQAERELAERTRPTSDPMQRALRGLRPGENCAPPERDAFGGVIPRRVVHRSPREVYESLKNPVDQALYMQRVGADAIYPPEPGGGQ
jgi:hypothetical protein